LINNCSSTDAVLNEMMVDLSNESPACFLGCVALQLLHDEVMPAFA